MNLDLPPAAAAPSTLPDSAPWWRSLNSYHWFVLMMAALGWLFDCLDQQLFNAARVPAMRELLGTGDMRQIAEYGGYATSIFLMGWATGGLAFGIMGDRVGRAKTMLLTILIYSLCTGLSALSVGFWDFTIYRFVTGLGVGGEFAVGVALVAEVMPDRARPYALGLLQALSTVGNVTAALVSMSIGYLEQAGTISQANGWRWMFVVGAVPAMLAVLIRRRLKEPERWKAIVELKSGKKMGSYSELFGNPRWRKHAIIGFLLAFVGVVGLWGILFFSLDLIRFVLRASFAAQGFSPAVISGKLGVWVGVSLIMMNIGAFFGLYCFGPVAQRLGRKPTFAIAFILAMLSTAGGFWLLDDITDIFWMIPIMGFCQFSLFAGYAIYFPELFPTRLRSTGTSFCYNVGRFVAALGPLTLGLLTSKVFSGYPDPLPLRYAGLTLCSVFLIGLLTLPFSPETRGQPLPED
ncbi:MAG: MFS transporter [Verrucomicrobia bacterium]|nr:MFS transporter [Verrucomicrobiota bacterium]